MCKNTTPARDGTNFRKQLQTEKDHIRPSEEELRRVVWNSRSFAVFEQLKGEIVDDGTNPLVKAKCIRFQNRAFLVGSFWRHQATSR